MLQTVTYTSEEVILGCTDSELVVGDAVQMAIEKPDESYPDVVLGTISEVCFVAPYGRKYTIEFDDFQLAEGQYLKECWITPTAYCCCDELRDRLDSLFSCELCEGFDILDPNGVPVTDDICECSDLDPILT